MTKILQVRVDIIVVCSASVVMLYAGIMLPLLLFDLLQIRIQGLYEDFLILPTRGKTGTVSDQAFVTARIETDRYRDGVVCPCGNVRWLCLTFTGYQARVQPRLPTATFR